MRSWRALFLSIMVLAQLSCSVNILENFADKNSDEAKFIDAKKLMNDRDYDGAIDKLDETTSSFQNERKVISLRASAYAGRCGMEFVPFAEALGNLGTTRLFNMLAQYYAVATPTDWADCITAENLLESLGVATARTNDENILMVLISFAKIGNILSFYTDTNDDGSPEAGYTADACNTSGTQTADAGLTDADQREVGSGMTLAIEALSEVSGTIDLGADSLTDVSGACTTLAGINPSYDFCSITDPTLFTADHLQAIRSLIREDSSIGVGSCVGDVSACLCP